MALTALVLGIIGTLLAVLPFSAVSQLLGLILGGAAAGLGYVGRRAAVRHGQPLGTSSLAMALGVGAILLSSVVFVSCQGCASDDPQAGFGDEFRGSIEKLLGGTRAGSAARRRGSR